MKSKTLLLILTLFVSASLLSACGAVAASNWSGVAADQDMVYLAHGSFVYAINLENQQELWRSPAEIDRNITFFAAPVLTPDRQLLIGSYGPKEHNLYSVNPDNGSIKWKFDQAKGDYIASPLATDTAIYAANADGTLYALDLNGKLLWTFKSEEPLWATPAINDACSCLFVPSMDHKLYALNVETGEIRWETGSLGGSMVASPAFADDGTVYIGTFANELVALSAENGAILWRYKTDGFVWTQPQLVDGLLYFGDSKSTLYAVDTAGKEAWKVKVDGPIATNPLIKNGNIHFTTGTDAVYAYDLEGNRVWQQTMEGLFQGPVISSGERLLVSPMNDQTALYVLNENGIQQWAFIPEQK